MKRRVVLLSLLPMIFVGGCSWTPKPVEDALQPPAPPAPEKPKAPHELGSLWSVDSRWNDIYSAAPTRQVGDVLIVKLTDAMRDQVLAVFPLEPAKPEDKDTKKKEAPQNEVREHENDTKSIEVVIKDVLPRNVFHVTGTATIRIGPKLGVIAVDAKVHEKDIAADDSVNADSLFGSKLEAVEAVTSALRKLSGLDRESHSKLVRAAPADRDSTNDQGTGNGPPNAQNASGGAANAPALSPSETPK
jgi:flagellar basal body L-ring protein FlgH